MKRDTCTEEARRVLAESFGIGNIECDRILRDWSEQAGVSRAKIATTLVHQIWHGDHVCHDKALVRFLEQRLRQLPDEQGLRPPDRDQTVGA